MEEPTIRGIKKHRPGALFLGSEGGSFSPRSFGDDCIIFLAGAAVNALHKKKAPAAAPTTSRGVVLSAGKDDELKRRGRARKKGAKERPSQAPYAGQCPAGELIERGIGQSTPILYPISQAASMCYI